MSSDLVRRQSVIELIDDLIKSPYANSPQFGAERRECMELVKSLCVCRLPTVYDVDKVVERLQVNSMYIKDKIEAFVTLDDAIEIVKSSGVE